MRARSDLATTRSKPGLAKSLVLQKRGCMLELRAAVPRFLWVRVVLRWRVILVIS